MQKQLAKTILYAALLLAVFATQQWIMYQQPEYIVPENGVADLGALDLARDLAGIEEKNWEFYPEQLYGPEDFAAGSVGPPVYETVPGEVHYGTYRLRVRMPPGRVYALAGKSFPFSQRVFVNGRQVDLVGMPAANSEEVQPRSKRYTYYFEPEDGTTELVYQTANFNHRDGVRNAGVKIAEPDVANRYRALELIRPAIVVGCFLAAFFYFLGMFIFFSRRMHFLFFALACLATGARMLFIGEKKIMEIFPKLDWFVALRVEYLLLVLFVVALQMYIHSLYPGMLNRKFVVGVLALSALYGGVVLLCDTMFFSRMLKWYSIVWAVAAVVAAGKLALRLRRRDLHTILIFTGMVLFAATAVFDEAAYRFFFHARTHNTLVAGMLSCVFLNMIALTEEAENRRRELAEANRLLDRLNAMKTQFMANVSHEMKTPLTVMSVHAQLSKALLASGEGGAGEVGKSLDLIAGESSRLGRMVTGVLELGGMNESQSGMRALDLGALLVRCGDAYRAVLEKKGNVLEVNVPEDFPVVVGDADMMTQMVFNLLVNANRHTENGTVSITASADAESVAVVVRDTGSGISPDLLPHVFERRVGEKKDGGAGLGLAISRTIMERHGGTIDAENAPGGGVAVRFVLPIGT